MGLDARIDGLLHTLARVGVRLEPAGQLYTSNAFDRGLFIVAFVTAFYSATLLSMCNKRREAMRPLSSFTLYLAYTALVLSASALLLMSSKNMVRAQPIPPSIVERVSVGVAVTLNDTGRLAASFPFACPNGTGYVLDERRRERPFMGCAPLGQQACSQTDSLEIEGSCAQGEACCFWGNKFRGCALSLRQCCYNTICPPGYTCCGDKFNSRCCPLPTGALVSNATLEALSCSAAGSVFPCLPAAGAVECLQTVDPVRCANIEGPADCGEAPPVHCQAGDDCRFGNNTLLYNQLNRTLGIALEYYLPAFDAPLTCCPNSGELCFSLGRSLIGCADPTRNETCCGERICGTGQQCCQYRIPSLPAPSDLTDTQQLTYVVESRCCPSEIPCCTHDNGAIDFSTGEELVSGAEYTRPQATYCGLPRNVSGTVQECAIVATAEPLYTFLYELINGSQ